MSCKKGLEVPIVEVFTGRLSCQDSGQWFPLEEFPDCVEPSFFTMALPAELYYEGDCNDDATKEMIKNAVLGYLASIQEDIESSICPGESCSVDNLGVICGESRKRRETERKKREFGFALVRFHIGAVFNTSNRDVNEVYEDLLPKLQMIGNRITTDVAAGRLDITGFVLDNDAFIVSNGIAKVCPEGYILDGFICKACPAGTYFNASSKTCELCPIGKYVENSGKSECDSCPPDHSTLKTGSKFHSNCTRLCEPGFVSGTTMIPCTACPQGSFQSDKGQTTCVPCPPGTTTSSRNNTSSAVCQPYDIQLTQFIGRHEVSKWSSRIAEPVFVLSFWVKLVHGLGPNTSLAISDGDNDFIYVNMQETVVVQTQSTKIEIPSKLSSRYWTNFMIEFDFSTYEMRAYVNNITIVQKTVLTAMTSSDTKLFLESSGEMQLSNFKVFNRTLSVQEREELTKSCTVHNDDQVSSFSALLNDFIDGISVVMPSECDPIDECSELPCGNHTCINKMDDFECICQAGWSGDTCKIPPDFCHQHECGTHSVCVNIHTSYKCNCTDNYSGIFCHTPPENRHHAFRHILVYLSKQNIVQSDSECPSLKRGAGTRKHCETNEVTEEIICNLTCVIGTTFPSGQRPYESYTCGRTTGYVWEPFDVLPNCEGRY
ncbi:SVEP1-like protein [Mya arenaria]|uniref:SVEP1-like protein n=1 Tax=Mya arenaria TaxID=6604 RepID=A0ABY7GDM4_MYAAR|nr:SVEP1-like protein [Mya arenaria]